MSRLVRQLVTLERHAETMEFRRSGQSDGRRRRVVLDEVRSSAPQDETETESNVPAKKGKGSSAKRYSDAALAENQPRITTILPSRWYTLLAVIVLGLGTIIGLEGLYARLALFLPDGIPSHLRALDITAPGNLASWLASSLLLATSLMSLVVFAVRRHRLDDYRGRYRLWGWVSGVCLLASIDATVNLRSVASWALHTFARFPEIGRGEGAWLTVALLATSWGLVRFCWETWQSRLARSFLVLMAGCYTAAATLLVGWWTISSELAGGVTRSALVMLGHYFAFCTVLTYARFVHRDAQGFHGRKKKRVKVAKKAAEPEPESAGATRQVGEKNIRVDTAHRVPAPASPALAGRPEKSPAAPPVPAAEIRKGNKSERRPGSK